MTIQRFTSSSDSPTYDNPFTGNFARLLTSLLLNKAEALFDLGKYDADPEVYREIKANARENVDRLVMSLDSHLDEVATALISGARVPSNRAFISSLKKPMVTARAAQ